MQAISWAMAAQTSAWTSQQRAKQAPIFNRDEVLERLRFILREQARFDNFFALSGIKPLRLTYEEIAAGPQAAVERVASHLDIPGPLLIDLDRIELRVQRTEENDRWADAIRRFVDEASPGDGARPSIHSRIPRPVRRLAQRILGPTKGRPIDPPL